MEGDGHDEVEDLSPAEALAITAAARETLVRRVATPWVWDAYMATSLGVVVWLYADFPTIAPFVILPWIVVDTGVKWARQRRAGVVSDGRSGRTSDPLRWWVPSVALVVALTGLAIREVWSPALRVAAVLAASVIYVGFRWINRRAVARIRDAA